jgi:hypothetical protein
MGSEPVTDIKKMHFFIIYQKFLCPGYQVNLRSSYESDPLFRDIFFNLSGGPVAFWVCPSTAGRVDGEPSEQL